MEMTDKALDLFIRVVQAAQSAQPLEVEGDGRTEYFRIGSEIKEIGVKPANITARVASLNDLINYQSDVKGDEFWHCNNRVVLILDRDDRRDFVTFPLTFSPAWQVLTKMNDGPLVIEQKALLRLLRLTFGVDPGIVTKFKKLDWSSGKKTSAEVSRGKESVGRSIQAEVSGADQLPEDLMVTVPMYRELGERQTYTIRVDVEADPINERFTLTPYAGEVDAAMDAHQEDIHARLEAAAKGKSVGVYYGSP